MANKIYNATFAVNTDGWAARNNASILRTTTDTYIGRGAVEVTVSNSSAQSGIYNTGYKVDYTPGKQIIFSAYVKVPDGAPDITITPTLYFYDSSNNYLSAISGTDSTISSVDGWVRLYQTGMATTSTATKVVVALQTSLSYIYQNGAKFLADAFMLEDGGVLHQFVEGQIPQAAKNQAVNIALTKLPQPHLTGMKLNSDIRINGLTLNTIDENQVVWVCTDINGWWDMADVDTPDIARGLDDGSYDVRGRRKARSITLTGSVLVPDPAYVPAVRQKLQETFDLVYKGAWLYVDESPTKAAFVRLTGQPNIDNVNARGRINFSIPLRAGDPTKFSWEDANNDGYTAVGLSNLVPNPSFASGTTGWDTSIAGASDVVTSSTYAYDGTYSLKITSNGASTAFGAYTADRYKVDGGDTYTWSMYVRDANTAVDYKATIFWYDVASGGSAIGSAAGQVVTPSTSGWYRVSSTAKAPVRAKYVVCVLSATSVPASGTIAYFDAAEFRKAVELAPLEIEPNLISNYSFEGGVTTPWASGSGSSSAVASTDFAIEGTYSFKVTANGTSTNFGAYLPAANRPAVIGGETYTFSMYVRDLDTGVQFKGSMGWYDSSGTIISGSTSTGTPTSISSSSWTRVSVTGTAPANATSVQPIMYSNTLAANGKIAYLDLAELRRTSGAHNTFIANNASNLNVVNLGNIKVPALYKLTGPITAPAYIRSADAAGNVQTIKVITSLRDTTFSGSISARRFTGGYAQVTIADHGFLVGDIINVTGVSDSRFNVTNAVVANTTATTVSYAKPISNIVSITHASNLATVVTESAHGLSSGNTFYINGSSNPVFDGAYTVVTNVNTTTFTFTKTTANQNMGYGGTLSPQIETQVVANSGTMSLAQVDNLEIDTYNGTVLYRNLPDLSRSTLAVEIDWIKLQPGDNLHTFAVTGGTGECEVKYRSGWIG